MKLNHINSINFYGKIIDSHFHVGNWSENGEIRDYTSDIDVFIKSSLNNGDTVEKIIVSNLDCMVHNNDGGFFSDEINGNKKILKLAQKNPKIAPLATCQPGYGKAENIKKLLQDNPDKFVGFKFHPEQLKLAANDSKYYEYMNVATENKIPCLFHSSREFDVNYPGGGVGKASEYSNPSKIYELARKYKDVPVIMAHWGGDGEANLDFTTKCIIDSVKNKDAKLYADISWVDCNDPLKPNLKRIIEQLKAENALDRILFGTDAPLGRFSKGGENGVPPKQAYENTLINIKNMIKREFPQDSESIINKIFYENASKLFLDKAEEVAGLVDPPSPDPPKKNGGKAKFLIFGGLAILGLAGWYYKKSKDKQNNESQSLDRRA